MPKKIRVALCQIDTTVGAFQKNIEKVCDFVQRAGSQGAELAVFPELTLSSYTPLDLLERPEFLEANEAALKDVRERIRKIKDAPGTVILGSIIPNPKPEGRPIQNAMVVFHGNDMIVQPKRLLPTYDVFDEARYFEPGATSTLWDSPWGKMGLSVCEDAWFDESHAGRKIYAKDPALDLRGADVAVNVSASPFELNKRERRQELLAGFVRRIGAPLIYVNQVGANDEILFDGGSLIYSADGKVLFELPSFKEELAVVDLELGSNSKVSGGEVLKPELPTERLYKGLVMGVRDYFRKTGFKKAVIGLSGGIDSAVVACLAAEALGPTNVLGVSMPSQYSSSHSLADAEALARAVGMGYRVHSLKFINTALLMELKSSFMGLPADSTEENIQARLRGMILMALANKQNALVLTTGNKSELGVGYCTTYGDMAGALAPLGDVYKTKVYELARYLNSLHRWIPESTLTKAPSAELRPNQTDQDTLPPYEVLDRLLEMHFEGLVGSVGLVQAGFDPDLVAKILKMVQTSEFKRRQAAPALKVTSKAFGLGRRVPIAKYVY